MSYTAEFFPRRENWLQDYWLSGLFFLGTALFLPYSFVEGVHPSFLLFTAAEALGGFVFARYAYRKRNAKRHSKPLISLSKDGMVVRDYFFGRVNRVAWQDVHYLGAHTLRGRTILTVVGRLEKPHVERRLDFEIDALSATEVNIAVERIDRGPQR